MKYTRRITSSILKTFINREKEKKRGSECEKDREEGEREDKMHIKGAFTAHIVLMLFKSIRSSFALPTYLHSLLIMIINFFTDFSYLDCKWVGNQISI